MKKRILTLLIFTVLILGALASKFNTVSIQQLDETGAVRITVNFYMDMQNQDLHDKIYLTSERPGTKIRFISRWINPSTLEIFAVEEDFPKGFKTRLQIGPLSTKIPGFYKSCRFFYRPHIPAFLTGLSPVVPSSGPIVLRFSTPVKGEEIEANLETEFDFYLRPKLIITPQGKFFADYSEWHVFPKQKLAPGTLYHMDYQGLLCNLAGSENRAGFSKVFEVASPPKVISTQPENNALNTELYMPITVNFDQDMKQVDIRVSDMIGDIELDGRTARFKPHSVFLPNRTYGFEVRGTSIFDEPMEPYTFSFTTKDMGNSLWVEVNLRRLQKVVIYRGDKALRSMPASGGLPDSENETPLGFFTVKDRGHSFFSERFGEGALYWVRIKDNYLFHSIPRDREGNIIKEELQKIGIPASHGCIRLKDDDAKWFYDNIPTGTLVIIHD